MKTAEQLIEEIAEECAIRITTINEKTGVSCTENEYMYDSGILSTCESLLELITEWQTEKRLVCNNPTT